MLTWTQAQSRDLGCFFLPLFTFYETFLCFLVVKLKKWQRTCLQGFREEEATGREHGILSMASFKRNLFYFFLVWENVLLNMFLTETSWRNQLCRNVITGCSANEAPCLEIRRLALAGDLYLVVLQEAMDVGETVANQQHVSMGENWSVLMIWPLSKVPRTNEKQGWASHKTVAGFLMKCVPLAKEKLPFVLNVIKKFSSGIFCLYVVQASEESENVTNGINCSTMKAQVQN